MTMEELVEEANLALKARKLIAEITVGRFFDLPAEPLNTDGSARTLVVELREPTPEEIKSGIQVVMINE